MHSADTAAVGTVADIAVVGTAVPDTAAGIAVVGIVAAGTAVPPVVGMSVPAGMPVQIALGRCLDCLNYPDRKNCYYRPLLSPPKCT
jgi:hypothetical protein